MFGHAPRTAIIVLSAWAALVAAPARAQGPSPAGPALPLAIGTSAGDPPAASGGLLPPLAVLPLRLSLQPALLPVEPLSSSQPCEPREEASGNTFHGFPLQGYASFRLTPRLSLHGFSTLGCPTDAGIGGAVTYATPLKPDLWLVIGAGVYTVPSAAAPAPPQYDFKMDLVKSTGGGRAFTFGVGRKGVTMGSQS